MGTRQREPWRKKGISALGMRTAQHHMGVLQRTAVGEPVNTAGRAHTRPAPPHTGLPVTLYSAGNFTLRESFTKTEHSFNHQTKVLIGFQLKSKA